MVVVVAEVGCEVGGAGASCVLEGGVVAVAEANEFGVTVLVCKEASLAAAEAILFSTTLLATTAAALEGAGLGAGPLPVSLTRERVLPLTMSESVLGPSSMEAWLEVVVGGAELGVSELEELGSGGKWAVARSNLGWGLFC